MRDNQNFKNMDISQSRLVTFVRTCGIYGKLLVYRSWHFTAQEEHNFIIHTSTDGKTHIRTH